MHHRANDIVRWYVWVVHRVLEPNRIYRRLNRWKTVDHFLLNIDRVLRDKLKSSVQLSNLSEPIEYRKRVNWIYRLLNIRPNEDHNQWFVYLWAPFLLVELERPVIYKNDFQNSLKFLLTFLINTSRSLKKSVNVDETNIRTTLFGACWLPWFS